MFCVCGERIVFLRYAVYHQERVEGNNVIDVFCSLLCCPPRWRPTTFGTARAQGSVQGGFR